MQKKLLSYAALALLLAPVSSLQAIREKQEKRAEQRQSLAADIIYTGLGLICCTGAVFTGKLTKDLCDTFKACNNVSRPDGIIEGIFGFAGNPTTIDHAQRWMNWYGDNLVSGGLAETIGTGALSGVLGVAGLLFLAKGLHLR